MDAIGWGGGAIERNSGPDGAIVPGGGETGESETPFVRGEGAFVREGARGGGDVALGSVTVEEEIVAILGIFGDIDIEVKGWGGTSNSLRSESKGEPRSEASGRGGGGGGDGKR